MLPESGKEFDSGKQFNRADFKVSSSGLLAHARWSKTTQLHQNTRLIPLVANSGSPLCPVEAVGQAFDLNYCPEDGLAFGWRVFFYHPSGFSKYSWTILGLALTFWV